MPTLDLHIDAGDLGRLTELPTQILAAVATAREALDGADTAASGNALGDLVAGLGALPGRLGDLPDLGPALAGLTGLGDLVPAGLPTSAAGAVDALASVTEMLAPLARLVDGDPAQLVAAAVDQLAGLTTTVGQQSTAALAVTGELRQFFTLLGSLEGWSSQPPPADEVAALVAKAFVGADLDLLAAPTAALERALGTLAHVLPDDDDLTRWHTGLGELEATWTGVEARLAGPTIDWRAVELDLQAAGRAQTDLVAVRDRLLAVAVSAVGRLDLGGLDAVAAALRAVPVVPEVRLTPVLDGFVAQLRGLRDGLQSWELGPDDVRRIVRALMQRLRDAIDHSAIGEIRRWLLGLEQRILAIVDGLPLRAIAREVTGALDGIAGAVDDVDLAGLIAPVTQLGDTVGAAISQLAGDAVHSTIGQVWDAVEAALGDAGELLGQLRDVLDSVTASLGEFTSRVGPAVSAITGLVSEVRVVVDAFDLTQPTAAVLETLHRARDTVAAIDVSLLPAAAVQLVGEAADALADIDVAAAVNGPIVEVLDAIDPGPALEAAVGVLADVATQLAAVDPSQLIATLDEPVGAVLDGLAALDPARLQALVDDAVAPVREAIGALDATAVLAPATQAFSELMTKLDRVLDPGPLFAPLQAAYQPVIDMVEALEPGALLDLVAPHLGGVTEQFGGAAGSPLDPAGVTGAGAGFTAVPSTVDATDDLFGLRPGDLLVPLIDLHHRLLTALEGLGAELLDRAGSVLHDAFGGGLAALHPDAVLQRLDAALARVDAEVGVPATTVAVSGGALAYQRVAARVAVAAGGATGDDVAVSVRVTSSLPTLDPLRLVPGPGQATALAAAAGVAVRADLAGLRSAYAVGVSRLERLLPDVLGDGLDGNGLLGAVRALDPAPVRDEVNALFDEAGHLLAGLGDVVAVALEEAAAGLEEILLPLNPSALLGLVTHIHAGLLAQVQAVAPATLAEHVRLVFSAVRRQLRALDPAQLVDQVNAVRRGLDDALDTLLDGLLPDPAPLHALQAQLEQLRPSQVLAPVTAALAPFSELAAGLDADAVVRPLAEGIDRIKEQVPVVIAQIEAAFDEVLRAFPEGGVSGVSGSVSGSVG